MTCRCRNGALPWRQGESGREPAERSGLVVAAMGPCLGGRENAGRENRRGRDGQAAMGPCLGGRENQVTVVLEAMPGVGPQWGPALEAGRIRTSGRCCGRRCCRNGALPWRQGESIRVIREKDGLSQPQWGPALEAGRIRIPPGAPHHPTRPQWGPALEAGRMLLLPWPIRPPMLPQWGPALEAGRILAAPARPLPESLPQWGPALEAGRIKAMSAAFSQFGRAAMGPCLGGRENEPQSSSRTS